MLKAELRRITGNLEPRPSINRSEQAGERQLRVPLLAPPDGATNSWSCGCRRKHITAADTLPVPGTAADRCRGMAQHVPRSPRQRVVDTTPSTVSAGQEKIPRRRPRGHLRTGPCEVACAHRARRLLGCILLVRRHYPALPQPFSPGRDCDGNGAPALRGLLTREGGGSPISQITSVECSTATAVARAWVPAMPPARRAVWGA